MCKFYLYGNSVTWNSYDFCPSCTPDEHKCVLVCPCSVCTCPTGCITIPCHACCCMSCYDNQQPYCKVCISTTTETTYEEGDTDDDVLNYQIQQFQLRKKYRTYETYCGFKRDFTDTYHKLYKTKEGARMIIASLNPPRPQVMATCGEEGAPPLDSN